VIRIALCGRPHLEIELHEEQRYEQRNGKKKDVGRRRSSHITSRDYIFCFRFCEAVTCNRTVSSNNLMPTRESLISS